MNYSKDAALVVAQPNHPQIAAGQFVDALSMSMPTLAGQLDEYVVGARVSDAPEHMVGEE
jgi:hypothetical protein